MEKLMLAVLFYGGIWGVFEATVGYLLHLLPFSIGWLVWYPIACFFMLQVYIKTKQVKSILLIGLLSCAIKLTNLMLPVRIDRVLNPAVSILFEAITMAAVVFVVEKAGVLSKQSIPVRALSVLCMNSGWRFLYTLYLLFLVPNWMRDISVISNLSSWLTFIGLHNLVTSAILFIGSLFFRVLLNPIESIENKTVSALSALGGNWMKRLQVITAGSLIGLSVALNLIL